MILFEYSKKPNWLSFIDPGYMESKSNASYLKESSVSYVKIFVL